MHKLDTIAEKMQALKLPTEVQAAIEEAAELLAAPVDESTPAPTKQDFDTAFNDFMKVAQKVIDDNWKRAGYTFGMSPILGFDKGPKYLRVHKTDRDKDGKVLDNMSRSAYVFIDRTNGDVLKSASWKKPAKHARGNIFDKDHGAGGISPYGGRYLR